SQWSSLCLPFAEKCGAIYHALASTVNGATTGALSTRCGSKDRLLKWHEGRNYTTASLPAIPRLGAGCLPSG
ncbi:MAG: hypothetical protein ACE5MM_09685, partial [Nitrospiraceae bacterium]